MSDKDKAVKANPDYTNSAERLTQSPEVKALLDKLTEQNNKATEALIDYETKRSTDPLYLKYKELSESTTDLTKDLKAAIDTHGGYQDTEKGEYALKMISYSTIYDIAKVRQHIPEYADKIIEEVVSAKKITGLLRGGLILPNQVNLCSEQKRKSATYIIKVV